MGYPARSHHNSFLFILKTMNFGTMNLNFRTLHSCMLAKCRVRQGDGDKARTLACVSAKEVAGRFLIMSNKNPKRHQTSGLSVTLPASVAAEDWEKNHQQHNPILHLQSLQDMADSEISVSRGNTTLRPALEDVAVACITQQHRRAEVHSSCRTDLNTPNHNPLSLHSDWKGILETVLQGLLTQLQSSTHKG